MRAFVPSFTEQASQETETDQCICLQYNHFYCQKKKATMFALNRVTKQYKDR